MRFRKLRHRPSDELIDIRERGLPWLLAVFILLFFLLTIFLIFLVFHSRDFYLSQRDLKGDFSDEDYSKSEETGEGDVHIDVVPIIDRKAQFSPTGPTSNRVGDQMHESTTTASTQEMMSTEAWSTQEPTVLVVSTKATRIIEEDTSVGAEAVSKEDISNRGELVSATDMDGETESTTEATRVIEESAASREPTRAIDESEASTEPTRVIGESEEAKRTLDGSEASTEDTRAIGESEASREPTRAIDESEASTEATRAIDESVASTEDTRAIDESEASREPTRAIGESEASREPTRAIGESKEPSEESTRAIDESTASREPTRVIAESEPSEEATTTLGESEASREPTRAIGESEASREPTRAIDGSEDSREPTRVIDESAASREATRTIIESDTITEAATTEEPIVTSDNISTTPDVSITSETNQQNDDYTYEEESEEELPPTTEKPGDIEWNYSTRSRKHSFKKFAISTHHSVCSKVGKKIYENGGNAIDAAIAAEFCISAVHPHSTGPGFGAVAVVYSSKTNNTIVIDGRERAPKVANENTFAINPAIAHIGYSSTAIPGWISTVWNIHQNFGSGRITWIDLIQPTLDIMKNGIYMDRLLAKAFESRKTHLLHEKSFNSLLNSTHREQSRLVNQEYAEFLRVLMASGNAEHEFYHGDLAKTLVQEIRGRGGLITIDDFKNYKSIITEPKEIKLQDDFLNGPLLPFHFPIIANFIKNLEKSYENRYSNLETHAHFFDFYIKQWINGQKVAGFAGDENESVDIVDSWNFPKVEEEEAEEKELKTKVPSFSRVIAMDDVGNSISFMSTNKAPFGSVRRSTKYGFTWNNAISSFDVFCKRSINCINGSKRPAFDIFPSILLNSKKSPKLLLSPTSMATETTSLIAMDISILKMNISLALDMPRIFVNGKDRIFVETGIPGNLHRHLWNEHRANFAHPSHPINLVHSSEDSIDVYCDFRESYQMCFPVGV